MNSSILYVGTDNGLFISFNRGDNWQPFMNGLPPVAVHDLVIQTEAKDLIVGTHGRSIYKVNLKSVQQLNEETINSALKIFACDEIYYSLNWGSSWSKWFNPNEPKLVVDYYTKNQGEVLVQVINEIGIVVFEEKQMATSGINQWTYMVEISKSGAEKWHKKDKKLILKEAKNGKTYLVSGKYQIKMTQKSYSQSTPLNIIRNEKN
jgi:ligand-binding sensor domain-containing protein